MHYDIHTTTFVYLKNVTLSICLKGKTAFTPKRMPNEVQKLEKTTAVNCSHLE